MDHAENRPDRGGAVRRGVRRRASSPPEKPVLGAARGPDGDPGNEAGRLQETEKQARFESVLRQVATDWRETFDALQSLILIVGGGGQVLRLNRAAVVAAGRTFQDCLGRTISDMGPGEPWRTMAAIAAERPAEAVTVQVEERETGRWWEVAGVRMTSGHQNPRGMIFSVRDVTGVVELEQSVRQSEKMAAMGELTAGVAHEVRNPLFAISASVDALGAVLKGQPNVTRLIDLMRGEVTRMNHLMESLLAYGKRVVPAVLTEGPFMSAVDLAVRSCDARLEAAGVTLTVHADGLPWIVRMDRERLSEVVTNLIENAVQHSPRGGVVSVDVEGFQRDRRSWIRCRVSDSGPGFSEDDIPRLFEPFFTRRKGGTGLGLSIAQRIVDQHGGRIHAQNRPEGGAEMAFELPCVGR